MLAITKAQQPGFNDMIKQNNDKYATYSKKQTQIMEDIEISKGSHEYEPLCEPLIKNINGDTDIMDYILSCTDKSQIVGNILLIHAYDGKTAPITIHVGLDTYELQSAGVTMAGSGPGRDDSGHAISASRCDGRSYVYDSNNFLVYTDWHLGKFENYKKVLQSQNISYTKIVDSATLRYLIYTKISEAV